MDFNLPLPPDLNPQRIEFVDAIKLAINRYTDFSGRSTVAEFWWFYLFTVLIGLCTLIPVVGYLFCVAQIALIVPSLAISWRRMHDIGKEGVYTLFVLIPIVGWILFIVWAVQPSQPGPNLYGPYPGWR